MTLAKATVSGTVFRQPEQRFTQNDVEVWGFTLSVDAPEETLVRVISKRKGLSDTLRNVRLGDRLLVDGRLQVATVKNPNGTDKKYFEIDANDIEILGGAQGSVSIPAESFDAPQAEEKPQDIVTFSETEDFTEETLVDEEDVPF
jgi:single-stranded DNA-binding protein